MFQDSTWDVCVDILTKQPFTSLDVVEIWCMSKAVFEEAPEHYRSTWLPQLRSYASTLEFVDVPFFDIEALKQAVEIWPWAMFTLHCAGSDRWDEWLTEPCLARVRAFSLTHQRAETDHIRDPITREWSTYTVHVKQLANCSLLQQVQHLKLEFCDLEDSDLQCLITSPLFANLKTLNLNDNYIEIDGVVLLANSLVAETLEALDLSGNHIRSPTDIVPCHFPVLERLVLNSNLMGDEMFCYLLECLDSPNLNTLCVQNNLLSDLSLIDFVAFSCSQAIEIIDLSHNRLTHEGIYTLSASPHMVLKELYVTSNPIDPAALTSLTQTPFFKRLELLKMELDGATPAFVQALIDDHMLMCHTRWAAQNHAMTQALMPVHIPPEDVMSELRSILHRDNWYVLGVEIKEFINWQSNYPQLNYLLSLISADKHDGAQSHRQYVSDLIKHVNVPARPVTSYRNLLDQIQDVPLPIYDIKLGRETYVHDSLRIDTSTFLEHAYLFEYARSLTFSATSESMCEQVLGSPYLKNLHHLKCEYTSQVDCYAEQLHHFGALNNLKSLDFSECVFRLDVLARLPLQNLQRLHFATFDESMDELKSFFERAAFTQLQSLALTETDLTELHEILRPNTLKHLQSLHLYETSLDDVEASHVFNHLVENQTLQILDFTLCEFSAEACRVMTEKLAHIRLKQLSLAGVPIGDDGVKVLAQSPILSNIELLDLADCNLTDDGVRALSKSPYLQSLRFLDIGSNALSGDSIRSLANANMPRLEVLDITETPKKFQTAVLHWILKAPYFKRLQTFAVYWEEFSFDLDALRYPNVIRSLSFIKE